MRGKNENRITEREREKEQWKKVIERGKKRCRKRDNCIAKRVQTKKEVEDQSVQGRKRRRQRCECKKNEGKPKNETEYGKKFKKLFDNFFE